MTEPVAVVGSHPRPLRHATVQFGVDERCDVDAVHDDVLQLAADLDVDQLDAAHAALVERGAADLRPGEVDIVHAGAIEEHLGEGGAPETQPLEARSGEVLLAELGHGHHARTSSGRSTSGSSRRP